MTPLPARTSVVGRVITRYVALKVALGRRYDQERRVLQALDAFLQADGGAAADLTAERFSRWAQTLHRVSPTVRRRWLFVVRNLCLYRRRTEPDCFVPDPAGFPAPHQTRAPHIFSPEEIARLLRATRTLSVTAASPLRPQVFRLALILLYTTGLRRGELLRLTVSDYDPRERVLLIRASKFHKSRSVPLSPSTRHEVERYLRACRRHHLPLTAQTPLIAHGAMNLQPYTGEGFTASVRQLLRKTGIVTPAGRLPRIHDFRHGFAVEALLRWYHQGLDVQTKLPFLATYMGHVSMVSTHYYLAFVEPLRAAASARFARHYGALVDPRAPATRRQP
jgi:integrase/recombinase XerD